ncbi:hypothetical protein F5B22DRAFT_634544 [Xylaria bambusicola]|uniref:uncharacterized protein n=1 Tax=Xylaria bambusicola TaxID=326684 RepID=UPI0020088AAB|nr:uncharacterized protein F5B22DRAFT_634544 [Xylaria bambusicola]KAI0521653.1 hypothetical protein F5B22DRAFT_634544 [Xylaria bambusicola]
MNELRVSIDTTMVRLDSSWEGQWSEREPSHSSFEPTPPSTSSLGGQTPTSSDNDGSSDIIGERARRDTSLSALSASRVGLARTIEDIVSSLTRTAEPFSKQEAWASIQAIAQDNIDRIVQRESLQPDFPAPLSKVCIANDPGPADLADHHLIQALDSTRDDMRACLEQGVSMQSHETMKITTQDVGSDLQQEEQLIASQGLLSNSLDISLRISSGGPSRAPLSRKTSRIDKRRSLAPRRRLPSTGGNGDAPNLRRGRPSERGFSCSHCAIAKKKLCIKADFKESRLVFHDLYKTRISTLLNNIVGYSWRDPHLEPIVIKISNGFDTQLELELQHYVARNENALTHTIFRGLEAGMIYPKARSTSFALRNGTLTAEKIDHYCERLACDMILRESLSSVNNSLLHHILLFAVTQIDYEDESSRIEGLEMVRLALRFWAIQAIFFTYPWRVESGGHLIRMYPLQLPGYWNGITLLPRLVNQELDRAFEKRMDEIEKEILEKLQVAIFKRHRDQWCSIFLASFILLHSLERDTWNMRAWDHETRSRGAAAWPLKRTPSEYCEQNKHIADIIATHFKIVNQGNSPLKQNWNKPLNQQLLSNSVRARRFILSIQSDFNSPSSSYKAELHQPKEFTRVNPQSLNYTYTQMLFGE